jgi:HPt (histidine-containing phosphotransfer) domain-containing protein
LIQARSVLRRFSWLLFVLWSIVSVVLWTSYRSTEQSVKAVDELGTKIDEVRNSFRFELPYRVQRADDISLTLQLIYAVRLQLESQSKNAFWAPDITQLLYTTDRFLESANKFVTSDLELLSLAEALQETRLANDGSEALQAMITRLGAHVLDALFTNRTNSQTSYQELDQLFIESMSLPQAQREDFQRLLAQASGVLSRHAQGKYLVTHLSNPDFTHQLRKFEEEVHLRLEHLVLMMTLLSGSFLIAFAYIAYEVKQVNPEQEPRLSDPQPLDKVSYSEQHIQEPIERVNDFSQRSNQKAKHVHELVFEHEPIEMAESKFIDIDKMLDALSGDEESVRMLLDVFIQDHAGDSDKLRQLLSEDLEYAQRVAHSLKGVSGSLGAMPLHYISAEIENLLKQGNQVPESVLLKLATILEETIVFARGILETETLQESLTD